MKYVEFAGGEKVPALGLGTWKLGVGDRDEAAQLRALQAGIACGESRGGDHAKHPWARAAH